MQPKIKTYQPCSNTFVESLACQMFMTRMRWGACGWWIHSYLKQFYWSNPDMDVYYMTTTKKEKYMQQTHITVGESHIFIRPLSNGMTRVITYDGSADEQTHDFTDEQLLQLAGELVVAIKGNKHAA